MGIMTVPTKFDCNVGQFVQMMNDNNIDCQPPTQRGLVWGLGGSIQKSKLIRSLLGGRAIGMFVFNRIGTNQYEVIDGQQRGTTIAEYMNDEFALHVFTNPVPGKRDEEVQIAKKKFSELPDYLQNRIASYGLVVYCYDNLPIEEKREIFEDINNGKPVLAAEITRTKVFSRSVLQRLKKHIAMETLLSKINQRKNVGEDWIAQAWGLIYGNTPSLLNKDLSPILQTTEITEEHEQALSEALDYIMTMIKSTRDKKILRKMKAKTHFVSLMYMAHKAKEQGMSDQEFADKAISFFTVEGNKATISEDYNGAVEGSAKPEKVKTRLTEIEKALK